MQSKDHLISPMASTVPAVAALGLFAWAYVWSRWFAGDTQAVTRILMWLGPLTWALCAALGILGFVACHRQVTRTAVSLGVCNSICLAAVLLGVLAVRLLLIPGVERLYYDEHAQLQIALAIADEGRAQLATWGNLRGGRFTCVEGSYSHISPGWPTLLAIADKAMGHARRTGFTLNMVLSLASIVLVALVAVQLFPGTGVPLAAGTIYAFLPANQIWSRTSASEILGAHLAVGAVFATLIFARHSGRSSALLLTGTLAAAASTRNESVVLIGVCAVVAAWEKRESLFRFVPAATAVLLLLVPQALHLGIVSRGYDPSIQGAGFAAAHVAGNTVSLIQYAAHEPVVLTCLFLALLGFSTAALRRSAFPIAVWAAAGVLIPLGHFGGSYAYPGGERFALAWTPALALLAGGGVNAIYRSLRGKIGLIWLSAGAVCGLLASTIWLGQHVAARDRTTLVPMEDCVFLRAALADTAENCLVVTADPPVAIVEGRSAVSAAWAADNLALLKRSAAEFPGGVFLFVSPSSSPLQWPGGSAALDTLLGAYQPVTSKSESTPDGVRNLLRLLPRRGD